MAKRKECSKINFLQFYEIFIDLLDEVKARRNKCVFDLLEFNGDGELDMLFLMQLFCNLNKNTLFGQEILKLVRKYKEMNILMKGGFSRQITLNSATFNDMVPYSSLVDEF